MSGQSLDRLVYMANQIPRMRAMILAHLQEGGAGLGDVAKAAVARLAGDAEPAPVTKATEFNSPAQGGSGAGSDAG